MCKDGDDNSQSISCRTHKHVYRILFHFFFGIHFYFRINFIIFFYLYPIRLGLLLCVHCLNRVEMRKSL